MFRVEQIDHVEFFVPDRYEAAAWYERILGCEIVDGMEHWAGDPGGPLMISPDGGRTKLALFTGEPQRGRETAGFHLVAFRVGGEDFFVFLDHAATQGIVDRGGRAMSHASISDHGEAFSVYFSDPWGHNLEVTTYDSAFVREALDG